MDSIIEKWKKTVENHTMKMQQVREQSLGRSDLSIRTEPKKEEVVKEYKESRPKGNQDIGDVLSSSSSDDEGDANKENCVLPRDPKLQECAECLLALFPETKLKTKKLKMLTELLQDHFKSKVDSIEKAAA